MENFVSLPRHQDINEAEANFSVARVYCQNFAFVHVAQAQFEHSQGKQWLLLTDTHVRTCTHTRWHCLFLMSGISLAAGVSLQAIQRKPFTYCKKQLNWGPNRKKCWRQPYRACKQEEWTCPVWRIRKMYHVSLYNVCFEMIKLAVNIGMTMEKLEYINFIVYFVFFLNILIIHFATLFFPCFSVIKQ